jgi:hypothetical protein
LRGCGGSVSDAAEEGGEFVVLDGSVGGGVEAVEAGEFGVEGEGAELVGKSEVDVAF